MSDRFCFYHGTHYENLPFILKNKTINTSTYAEDKHYIKKEWGGSEYIYGGIYFYNIDVTLQSFLSFCCYIVLNKYIMKNQTLIFNSTWIGHPIQDEQTSNANLDELDNKIINNYNSIMQFSIYLNPNDPKYTTDKKIKIIYNFIKKKHRDVYSISHEILIPSTVHLKNTLCNVIFSQQNKKLIKIKKLAIKLSKKISKKNNIDIHDISEAIRELINKYFNTQCQD